MRDANPEKLKREGGEEGKRKVGENRWDEDRASGRRLD
jgi:hypothetical protein